MCKEISKEMEEYVNVQTGEKLDLERINHLPNNAMIKVNPNLWIEWDFEKNKELGFDIWKMTKGSEIMGQWICIKCNSKFQSKIYSRINGTKCGYCAGQRVNQTNALASLNPSLSSEWHPTLNGNLTPYDVTCGSGQKVWWLGSCGHEWEAVISSRNSREDRCPYCSNKKVLIGFNDLWTINPELAKLLVDSENGYKYTSSSHISVDWRCLCGNIIKNKAFYKVNSRGLSCPNCSDGKSYPEKFIICLLNKLDIEFHHDSAFSWSQSRRFDFYIPSLNLIIETHGAQHYDGKRNFTNRNLDEEISNDKYKRELAISYGIKHYVELDCSESNMSHMIKSINNSELVCLFDLFNVDYKEISKEATSSLIYKVCKYYTENDSVEQKKLSKIFNISDKTIREYLKKGNELGLCNYIPNNPKTKSNSVEHMRIKVVQLDLEGTFIKIYDSISEAGKSLGKKSRSSISACCKGKAKSTYGYTWMYLEDYEAMLENQNKIS